MSDNKVEMRESGLVCDNPNCDWADKTITFENCKEWINKPCPKCGENVLTEKDYENAEFLRSLVEFFNSLTEEEQQEWAKQSEGKVDLQNIPGLSEIDKDKPAVMRVDTHKEIKIVSIRNEKE